jgi:asparagine synthetase B (glutamine-hydrolysing)
MNRYLLETDQIRCCGEDGREMVCRNTGQAAAVEKTFRTDGLRFQVANGIVRDRFTVAVWTRDANPAEFSLWWPEAAEYMAEMRKRRVHGYDRWQLPARRLRFGPLPEERAYRVENWQSRLRHVLEKAVQRRLVADVPVGMLLSSGLYSSLVVGLLADAEKSDLNTFSIGFESTGGERGEEFEYSDRIADHYGTVHHKINVGAGEVLPAMEACGTAMSEPMVSHGCIDFYLLSSAVSRHVKMVQSGQGVDEVFAGYHW